MVKKYSPEHFYQSTNPQTNDEAEAARRDDAGAAGREFWISWYGIPIIRK